MRVQRALDLLQHTGLTRREISGPCGFSDVHHFAKTWTIAFVGWTRAFSGTLDLGREAHFNNASLVFSRASSEPNRDHPRWDRRRIATSCWDLLANGAIYCERIVDPVMIFDEALRICEEYADRNPQHGKKLGVTPI